MIRIFEPLITCAVLVCICTIGLWSVSTYYDAHYMETEDTTLQGLQTITQEYKDGFGADDAHCLSVSPAILLKNLELQSYLKEMLRKSQIGLWLEQSRPFTNIDQEMQYMDDYATFAPLLALVATEYVLLRAESGNTTCAPNAVPPEAHTDV